MWDEEITGYQFSRMFTLLYMLNGVRGGAVVWGHCATSRKVVSSIPDGVTGICHWHNASSRTMAVGLTQPLTEMSTRNIAWGGG